MFQLSQGCAEGTAKSTLRNLFNKYFVQMPDIIYILFNCSVRCKFTCACCVQHSHTSPAFFIFVCFFYFLLCCCIGAEVSKDEVLVCSLSTILVEE